MYVYIVESLYIPSAIYVNSRHKEFKEDEAITMKNRKYILL